MNILQKWVNRQNINLTYCNIACEVLILKVQLRPDVFVETGISREKKMQINFGQNLSNWQTLEF